MKKILNFSRVAIALFCFMLIGLVAANAATISTTADKDPNKRGIQVCQLDPVPFTSVLGAGDVAPSEWQISFDGFTWLAWDGASAAPTYLGPKPAAPGCVQFRLRSINIFFPFVSFSNVVTVCTIPDKGPIGMAAPAFVCQDAPDFFVSAHSDDATALTIANITPGGGAFTSNALSDNLTRVRGFDPNAGFFGVYTFEATASGCVAGVFTVNAMTEIITTDVRRALNHSLVEATVITSSTGSNQVCEGDAVTYTASNSRAFGNPLFSFSLSNPAAGVLVGGPNSATGAKTINWSAAYPPGGPNPVQVVATAFGCMLNQLGVGPGNGAPGMDAVGVFPVFIRQRPIVQAFQTLGANPDCPGQCRVLQIFFDEINGFAGNKDIVIHTTDGNPDITYQSAANPVQIVVCPDATTTYSIVSVTAAGPPNNVCSATGPFPGPRTLTVTPNTSITSLTAAPGIKVCLGTNITLTAAAVGGGLTYTWRKTAGVGASATPLQGPNGTNTFVVSGASVNNSGTYEVQVSGTCGPDQFQSITVTICPPSVGGTIAPALVNRCGIGPNTLTLTGQTGAVLGWERQPNCAGPWIAIGGTAGLTSIVVTAPAGATCYRARVQNAPCPVAFSSTARINVDLPAVGGIVVLQSNMAATSTTLCGAQNAVLLVKNFVGKVQKWQYSTINTGIWIDIPGTAGQTTLTVNGSSISTTTFFRACICTKLGICTGPAAIAYSASFRVVKKALCPGPDGSIVNEDLPEEKTAITRAYPTPTTHRVTLDIEGAAEGLATIEVVDLIGRVVKSQKTELFSGANQVSVDISELASGIYIVRFTDKENHRASMKITRQ